VSPEAFRGPREMAFDFHRDDSLAGMREYGPPWSGDSERMGSLAMVELCHAGPVQGRPAGRDHRGAHVPRPPLRRGGDSRAGDRAGIEKGGP
jgi:hypothetical protein